MVLVLDGCLEASTKTIPHDAVLIQNSVVEIKPIEAQILLGDGMVSFTASPDNTAVSPLTVAGPGGSVALSSTLGMSAV